MSPREAPSAHVFGRTRPSAGGTSRLHQKPKRDTHFRPLPAPTGNAPFHLDLGSVLPAKTIAAIVKEKRLTFHVNGDLGGIGEPMQQQLVASGMEADFKHGTAGTRPSFLYVVGDCVYYNGETTKYYEQFYHPYEFYPAPIFAVPGNHDGENLPTGSTLDGFVYNFCASKAVKRPESQDAPRTAMIQPNVYWALRTPLLNVVGLYSNVPAGGEIQEPQKSWLVQQLKTLPKTAPLFVALHHPLYSADDVHSGSTNMKDLLAWASAQAGRSPEVVLAGHVHDYQRLTHLDKGNRQTLHLVTGAGGYPNLHGIMHVDGHRMVTPSKFFDKGGDEVTLEKYSDDHHGFLRIEVTDRLVVGRYFEVPRPHEPYSKGAQLLDYFEFDWRKRVYVPNTP